MLIERRYINDLVPRRFATKKIQMLVEAAVACTDDLNSMFNIETTLQPLVDSGDMPAAAKDKTMKKKLAEFDERWLKVRFSIHPPIPIYISLHFIGYA